MIERLQRIATILVRFRLPVFVLAGFSFAIIVLSLLDNPWLDGDSLLMPAILGLCWALMLYSTGELFQNVPGKAAAEDVFRQQAAVRVRRILLWILGILTTISALALLLLSYQLLRIWL
ncbi:MAG: hypothetical protein P8N94_02820 [Gammaproteobacteria bacterium]|jgi:hypothetical protein|nr:hypothetical protein [Gammaproteobacteria bacterium]MDG2336908.1 hypothetical protein [Gammaproteobacteria bacterium]